MPLRGLRRLKQKLLLACHILSNEGIFDAHGHLSARVPGSDLFLITPRESPAFVDPHDFVLVDRDGRVVKGRNPPSEVRMHTAIYTSRADVTSVSHFHSPMAIALGIVGKALRPVHGEGRLFSDGVPMLASARRIRSRRAAEKVAARLGQRRAILLRGHGAIVVGESIEMAAIGSIYLEEAARMQCLCSLLGEPRTLSRAELIERPNPVRVWNYYLRRLQRFGPRSRTGLFL